jgi:hypothetical protein
MKRVHNSLNLFAAVANLRLIDFTDCNRYSLRLFKTIDLWIHSHSQTIGKPTNASDVHCEKQDTPRPETFDGITTHFDLLPTLRPFEINPTSHP